MDITSQILNEFHLSEDDIILDEFICENDDLMWIKSEINYMVYVPSYMLWCLKNRERDGNLICDNTINALAEYGRAKDLNNEYLSFKFQCSNQQKQLVRLFLSWCSNNLEFCNIEQIERSIKHWQ
jgi:hypothetical protein